MEKNLMHIGNIMHWQLQHLQYSVFLMFKREITLTHLQLKFSWPSVYSFHRTGEYQKNSGSFLGTFTNYLLPHQAEKKINTWKYTGMVYFFTLEEQIHLYFKQIFFKKLLEKVWLWAYLWSFCIVWSCVLALSIFVFPYKHLVPACCQQTCLLGMMG